VYRIANPVSGRMTFPCPRKSMIRRGARQIHDLPANGQAAPGFPQFAMLDLCLDQWSARAWCQNGPSPAPEMASISPFRRTEPTEVHCECNGLLLTFRPSA
jgi:hypothetical protein